MGGGGLRHIRCPVVGGDDAVVAQRLLHRVLTLLQNKKQTVSKAASMHHLKPAAEYYLDGCTPRAVMPTLHGRPLDNGKCETKHSASTTESLVLGMDQELMLRRKLGG